MKQFFDKYKVLFTGIAAALAITLQEFIGQDDVSLKVIGIACILAIAGVIGNYLRGQYVSMAGIIGVALMTLQEVLKGGTVDWKEVLISAAVALLTLVSPPAKPRAYEHDSVIESAKNKQ